MSTRLREVKEPYASALREYFDTESETALEHAYQIGRRAVEQGLGILDMIALHTETLMAALDGTTTRDESRRMVERAARFFAESLSPFEMTHRGYRETNAQLRRLADTLEQRIAERTAEAEHARDAAEALARRMGFLAEASNILASSLDYHEALRKLARLATPTLADWCLVDVVEDRRICRVAMAHAEPAKRALLRELLHRYPPTWNSSQPAIQSLRSGEPELVPDVTDALLEAYTGAPEYAKLVRKLGIRSHIAVPLVARGQTVGAIGFVSATRRYGPDDLLLAEEVARRAAVAIDNARLYEATLASSKAKSDFLAVMSHEIRTPLNAITGYTDLLEAGVAGPLNEEQKQLLERVKINASHQLRIIEEILTFSRMEAGREEVRPERVDLSRLVKEVAELARAQAEAKGLRFRVRGPEEPTPVVTDPQKVRHILLDILSNAVKFTPEGEVALETELTDGGMTFQIRDTGIGIAPEHQERIFDPFVQIEEVLTREKGGTGLGLSIARRVARLMGGDVTVESDVGKGSTFTVRLPVRLKARPAGR